MAAGLLDSGTGLYVCVLMKKGAFDKVDGTCEISSFFGFLLGVGVRVSWEMGELRVVWMGKGG